MVKLIIDTREQTPYIFKKSVSEKLDYGDYALVSDDKKMLSIFERKNPSDLFQSLTKEHKRFIKEIERAKLNDVPFKVIIECSYSDVYYKRFPGAYNIRYAGWMLCKILHMVMLKYDVDFVFCQNRTEARMFIKNSFDAAERFDNQKNGTE